MLMILLHVDVKDTITYVGVFMLAYMLHTWSHDPMPVCVSIVEQIEAAW